MAQLTPTPGPSPVLEAFQGYVDALQARLTQALARIDGTAFQFEEWTRPGGGGGRMAILRDGPVLEKGACHVSKVHGPSNPLTGKPFCAAGLSLILHPRNPHAPAVHLNLRRFEEAEGGWWGGGADLTPMGVRHDGDVRHFHGVLRRRLGHRYGEGQAEAERYFTLPHRGRTRGAGGVFYDQLDTGDAEADHAFIQAIGDSFEDAYLPILERRKDAPHEDQQRQAQLRERGVYAEFNLLYDRGTRFGFQSGGNVEAILSSLPPLVRW